MAHSQCEKWSVEDAGPGAVGPGAVAQALQGHRRLLLGATQRRLCAAGGGDDGEAEEVGVEAEAPDLPLHLHDAYLPLLRLHAHTVRRLAAALDSGAQSPSVDTALSHPVGVAALAAEGALKASDEGGDGAEMARGRRREGEGEGEGEESWGETLRRHRARLDKVKTLFGDHFQQFKMEEENSSRSSREKNNVPFSYTGEISDELLQEGVQSVLRSLDEALIRDSDDDLTTENNAIKNVQEHSENYDDECRGNTLFSTHTLQEESAVSTLTKTNSERSRTRHQIEYEQESIETTKVSTMRVLQEGNGKSFHKRRSNSSPEKKVSEIRTKGARKGGTYQTICVASSRKGKYQKADEGLAVRAWSPPRAGAVLTLRVQAARGAGQCLQRRLSRLEASPCSTPDSPALQVEVRAAGGAALGPTMRLRAADAAAFYASLLRAPPLLPPPLPCYCGGGDGGLEVVWAPLARSLTAPPHTPPLDSPKSAHLTPGRLGEPARDNGRLAEGWRLRRWLHAFFQWLYGRRTELPALHQQTPSPQEEVAERWKEKEGEEQSGGQGRQEGDLPSTWVSFGTWLGSYLTLFTLFSFLSFQKSSRALDEPFDNSASQDS